MTLDLLRILLPIDDDPEALDELGRLCEVLRPAANRPRQRAAVAWLSSRVAAAQADPVRAESLLREVLSDDPDNADAIDELGWYRSDRGDAEGARSLWLQLEDPSPADLDSLPAVDAGSGPKLRRNEPCWCGSGRKFKACHLRIVDRPALPDRFGWLLRKPVAFVERRAGAAAADVARAAFRLGGEDREAVLDAWSDPLVFDVVLHEFGWLDRFLVERGALLPDDERMLLGTWQLAERSVFEVLDTRPSEGLIRLRDLRTGDVEQVVDHLFSQNATRRDMICARLLDDGRHKRLGHGPFSVPPGREGSLLKLLDLADRRERGEQMLSWMAAASQLPELRNRESEPLMLCRARLGPVDPDDVRLLFDAEFDSDGVDRWVELFALPSEEKILRAILTLDADEVLVETNSEERLDRLLDRLGRMLPGSQVLEDEREPMPVDAPAATSEPEVRSPDPGTRAVLSEIVERQERRWCEESVPALGGLTPRQAAEDPTRREEVERLLASMPEGGVSPLGFATMRPARLRELLGLG